MVSSTHTVVDCVVRRRRRGAALVNTGPWKLFSSRVHSGCVPTQWLCVLFYRGNPLWRARGGTFYIGRINMSNIQRGAALVNTRHWKLFSCRVHSGCMCPHSGYVRCFIGGTPDKHGALESCFPVGFYRWIDHHSGFIRSHSGWLLWGGGGGGERPW